MYFLCTTYTFPFWQISCFLGFPFIKKSIDRRELKDYLKHFLDDRNITRRRRRDYAVYVITRRGLKLWDCKKEWSSKSEFIYGKVWAIFVAIYERGVEIVLYCIFIASKKRFKPFFISINFYDFKKINERNYFQANTLTNHLWRHITVTLSIASLCAHLCSVFSRISTHRHRLSSSSVWLKARNDVKALHNYFSDRLPQARRRQINN